MQQIRGARIAMVFQDPFSCLNPTMTLGAQVAEPIRLHKGVGRGEARVRLCACSRRYAYPTPSADYGSTRTRSRADSDNGVMIAMAFACNPELLIADEPTTALDVTVQAQVLALMADMQRKSNAGVLNDHA